MSDICHTDTPHHSCSTKNLECLNSSSQSTILLSRALTIRFLHSIGAGCLISGVLKKGLLVVNLCRSGLWLQDPDVTEEALRRWVGFTDLPFLTYDLVLIVVGICAGVALEHQRELETGFRRILSIAGTYQAPPLQLR